MQLCNGLFRYLFVQLAIVVAAFSFSVQDANAQTQLVATISVQSNPFGVAVNPRRNLVYVTNNGSDTLSVIDAASNSVVANLKTGSNPRGVTVDESGDFSYVANLGSDSVSVIDNASNTVVADIPVCGAPEAVVIDSTTGRAFVADSDCDQVSIIDSWASTVSSAIYGGGRRPVALALNRSSKLLYVANLVSHNVGVIDTTTETLLTVVRVGTSPAAVAVDEPSNEIYVANIDDGTVSVIDGNTNLVVAVIGVGAQPMFGLVLDSSSRRGYVTNSGSGEVYVLDLDSKAVLDIIPLGIGLTGAAINSSTGNLYVANFVEDTVMTLGEGNMSPIANAGPDMSVEWEVKGASVRLDGSLSADPDGDVLSFAWDGPFLEGHGVAIGVSPTVTLPSLGPSVIRLTVRDGDGGLNYDWVTISVVDTTAPKIVLNLVPLVGDAENRKGKSRRFIAEFSATDDYDAAPMVSAVLVIDDWPDGIPINDGQIIQYKPDDDVRVNLNRKGGLKIEAPSLVLRVTAGDSGGNMAQADWVLPSRDKVHDARKDDKHRIKDGSDDDDHDEDHEDSSDSSDKHEDHKDSSDKKGKVRHTRHHGRSYWS